MKILFLFIYLFIVHYNMFSQAKDRNKDEEFAREIVIEERGIYAVSRNALDTITMDVKNNAALYCYSDSSMSFWYKIYAKADCEITFDIFPTKGDNTYNYFLYKHTGDINISDIKANKICAVRANLFKDKMALTGTGLSQTSDIDYNDTGTKNRIRQFYHTAYHDAVHAKAGDILLLNIYHVNGTDCGHQFLLFAQLSRFSGISAENTNKYSQKFQSLYQTCYTQLLASTKVTHSVNLKSPPAITNPEIAQDLMTTMIKTVGQVIPPLKNEAKAKYVVWDSIKHSILDAEINWIKRYKNSGTSDKGKGEITLEKGVQYHISFSAIGYKTKSVSFATKDSIASFTHYVFLTPVKEGDDFVMDKIYFYANTYSMKPGALLELNKLIIYLNANPEIKIEIQGHTNGNKRIKTYRNNTKEGSFTGSAKKLSQCRAENIKKYLTDKGIAEERLIANGYGGSKMICPKPKNQEEANKNIRVGVRILTQKEIAYSSSIRSK